MKQTAKQRRCIRFTTYDNDRNQGFNVWLGDVEVFVDRVITTTTSYEGCCSRELKQETIDIVTMDGRTFIPSRTTFWKQGDPEETITLPYGFVPGILRNRIQACPKCGHAIPKRGPAQCKDGHWLGSPEHPVS